MGVNYIIVTQAARTSVQKLLHFETALTYDMTASILPLRDALRI